MTDCEKIADIIKNYRYSELHRNFDAAHVARWAGQFSDESRDTILRETYSILSDWYYSIERIEKDFLNGMVFNVIDDIYKKSGKDIDEVFDETAFLRIQEHGQSQIMLVDKLQEIVAVGIDLNYINADELDKCSDYRNIIYLDDGLWSGSRMRKDMGNILPKLGKNTEVYLLYIIASRNGAEYSMNRLARDYRKYEPNAKLHLKSLRDFCDAANDIYRTNLWPDESLENIEAIKAYSDSLRTSTGDELSQNAQYWIYRRGRRRNDKGIFSSVEARNIVEKEFVLKGIELKKIFGNFGNGIRPLGYSILQSFGVGAFFATDLNVPNTAPLVLWADEWAGKGWYPLFPRRRN